MTLGVTHTSGVAATGTLSDPGYGAAVGGDASGSFAVDQIRPELGLDPTATIVTLDGGTTASMPGGGPCPAATAFTGDTAAGAGWMDTGVSSPKTVAACAQTEASTVKLFPTTGTAPQGLIQVESQDVIARCEISGASRTATTSGTVRVRWLTTSPSTYSAWTVVTLSGTTVTGTLPALTTPLANGKKIGDYLGSWTAFGGVEAVATTDPDGARVTSARVPASLTLDTVAMRNLADGTPDPDTAVKVTVGRALCAATDRR